jgi:hypothetical protein
MVYANVKIVNTSQGHVHKYHTHMLYQWLPMQWCIPDDGHGEGPKHVEFLKQKPR